MQRRCYPRHGGPPDGVKDDDGAESADSAAFADCLNGPDNPPALACSPGTDADLDGNDDVDLHDFATFQANFTGSQ